MLTHPGRPAEKALAMSAVALLIFAGNYTRGQPCHRGAGHSGLTRPDSTVIF